MNIESSEHVESPRLRRRTTTEIKRTLRDFNNQIALLNHRVGSRMEVRDVDLDCLDYIAQHGSVSPSELARRVGLPRATMTGVLDRLETAGWIERDRDTSDRRSIVVRVVPARVPEILRHYAGMDSALDDVLGGYDQAQLDTIADFLERARQAGVGATDMLSAD